MFVPGEGAEPIVFLFGVGAGAVVEGWIVDTALRLAGRRFL